jgi:VWFA-related protein
MKTTSLTLGTLVILPLIAIGLGIGLQTRLHAQQTSSQSTHSGTPPGKIEDDNGDAIKVDVDVVNLYCSVRSKQNGLIGNLEKGDFDLAEDGTKQTIKYFTRETDLPLTIGLLVDVSNSQRNLIEIERRAASSFFSSVLKQKDVAFLISFGADAELLQDITGSPRSLQEGLGRMKLNGGFAGLNSGPVPTMNKPRGTILYDAVYLAANDMLAKEVGRKAIVLITDGDDQGSRETEKSAIEAAQKADAIIYGILYVDREFYGFGGMGYSGEGSLRRMAEETGGRLLQVDRKNSLDNIFTQIQQEMRSQYAIGYTPTNSKKDGSYRKIDLRASSKDYKVQVRKGYYAMPPIQ